MVIHGVIRPPPEIRAVADRTALYVAKNGRAFEKKILSSEKGRTPKFAFLLETSPFHAYYEDRVQFYENGGEDSTESKDSQPKKQESEAVAGKGYENSENRLVKEETAQRKASVIDPISKALLLQRSKIANYRKSIPSSTTEGTHQTSDPTISIPPPPTLEFVNIVAPASLSIAQIETIQLTAQFTALDGRGGSFLSQLSMREWNNPTFAFCQPRHGHFPYFTALVDAYRGIIDKWTASDGDKANDLANNDENCLEVAAYRAEYERDQDVQSNKRDEAKLTAQVDWHNFVVVETIEFPIHEVVEISMLPPPRAPVVPHAQESEEIDQSEDEIDDEPIRVVPTYKPKVVAAHESAKLDYAIDPITGKSVPLKDMPEHMRIQLLDPKWAEERKKYQEKQKESNLVTGDIVASNIQRLARGDKFGKDHDILSGETDAKKRLEEANRIIREQKSQPGAVGPQTPVPEQNQRKRLPMTLPAPAIANNVESESKRPRVSQMQGDPATYLVSHHEPPPLSIPPDEIYAASASLVPPAPPVPGQSNLLSEVEFAASLSKPDVTLQIRIPNDPSQIAWNFYGQIVSFSTDVMTTVKTVKDQISKIHLNNIPVNKLQLKNSVTKAFLKDGLTLAALNLGPQATLELVPRARGGRK